MIYASLAWNLARLGYALPDEAARWTVCYVSLACLLHKISSALTPQRIAEFKRASDAVQSEARPPKVARR